MSAVHQKFDDVQVGSQVNALSLALNLMHLISASYTRILNGIRWYHLKLIIADSIDAVSKLGMLVQLLQKLCGSIVETCLNCLHVTRNRNTTHTDLCHIEANGLARQLQRNQSLVYVFEHFVCCDGGRHAPLSGGSTIGDAINYHAFNLRWRQL